MSRTTDLIAPKSLVCKACRGDGKSGDGRQPCPLCDGSGLQAKSKPTFLGRRLNCSKPVDRQDLGEHYKTCPGKREPCPDCAELRAQIVEALEGVDTDDWNSYDGNKPRDLGSVLRDLASRLKALG